VGFIKFNARRALVGTIALSVILIAAADFALERHLIIPNRTASMPLGLYVRVPGHKDGFERGDIVAVCLSDVNHSAIATLAIRRGYVASFIGAPCEQVVTGDRLVPLIKRVVALAGDEVEIVPAIGDADGLAAGIYVNGQRLAGSAPRAMDRAGRVLPQAPIHRRLEIGEYLVLGESSSDSFDSRYFGPLPQADLVARLAKL